jgi:hypothetical protein
MRATVRSSKWRRHSCSPVSCETMKIKCSLRIWVQECGVGPSDSEEVQVADFCEHANEYSVSYKARNVLTTTAITGFSRRTELHVINCLHIFFSRCSSGGVISKYIHQIFKQEINSPPAIFYRNWPVTKYVDPNRKCPELQSRDGRFDSRLGRWQFWLRFFMVLQSPSMKIPE